MNTIAAVLFFTSLIFLLIGLIQPSIYERFKIHNRKRVFAVFLVLFAVYLFIAPKDYSSVNTTPTPTIKRENESKPTSSTKKEEKQTNIYDLIWIDIDRAFSTRSGYHSSYDSESKTVTLTYKSKSGQFWDENIMVRESYSMLVKYGKEVFSHPEVEMVVISLKGPLIDTYGNESLDEVVRIEMSRGVFEKFNWSNLEYVSVYNAISQAAEYHYIHPAIFKSIDTNKLFLTK